VVGNNAKKGADDELFMVGGKYTTCDHHDHPHFYLQLTRAKVKPKKNVVTGPAYLVVEDVPLPMRYLSSSSRFQVVIRRVLSCLPIWMTQAVGLV
jgi:hypothetical protein